MKQKLRGFNSVRFGLKSLSIFLTAAFLFTLVPSQALAEKTCAELFSRVIVRSEQQIAELRIMSYNVENLFASTVKAEWVAPGQMRVTDRNSQEKPPEKLAEIQKLAADSDADIFILTEIEGPRALELFANSPRLAGRYRWHWIQGNDTRGINIGFLVKADLPWQISLITHRQVRWRDTSTNREGPLFSRDLPVLEFRRNLNDVDPLFAVIGNHAKSKRDMDGDPESTRWRTAQYAQAAQIVRNYRARRVPVILGGDFNADLRRDPELHPILAEMRSSLAVAPDAVPEDQRTTHTYHPRNQPTHFSQMDDVLVTPELASQIVSSRILRYVDQQGNLRPIPLTWDQRNLQPSDHFPVMTILRTQILFSAR